MVDIDFARIEKKWQDAWKKEKVFEVTEDLSKKKYYVLEMFPYPSGSGLHMGHAWNYSIGDIMARFKKLQGFNVLHPMGYDAFGLPAENAAIQEGVHPAEYTKKSIANFTKQFKSLGISYDWSRMIDTSKPEYAKWDQWIFLKMLEKGLAYQKESAVNWCSKCNTVLANEQVHEGKCWRHEDTEVDMKSLKQWFLKITDYADELYEGIEKMDWPDRTKAMQKNWIGKSHGTEIDFEVNGKPWPIFTTRPDTIFGVTFMVVAAGHPKLNELVTEEQRGLIDEFLKKIKSVSQKSMKEVDELNKEGVFTGSYTLNPVSGRKIPIWIANFVLADYGSGMVMADAHDQRDLEFAQKYGIDLVETVLPKSGEHSDPNKAKRAFTDYGMLVNSGQFDGLETAKAIEEITDWLISLRKGRRVVNFKLRDWGISRQRYWGTAIPIIHCLKCGAVPVPESDLPVVLPENVEFGKGNPLETNEEWLTANCPKCEGKGRREADTMDTFVNSSWYFLRYCDPHNNEEVFGKKKAKYWSPVDRYIGGAEHACMHLIYSRFYVKFLRDLGLIDFDEPALQLFHQGMLSAEGGKKMSKSKGVVVLPEEVSKKYGMDTARFFLSSLASPDKNIDWSEAGIIGSFKFIRRVLNYYGDLKDGKDSPELLTKLDKVIFEVTSYYEHFQYRKATIAIRELFDMIEKGECSKDTREKFLKIINPICPHITEELWEKMGSKSFIAKSTWPEVKGVEKGKEREDLTEKISLQIKTVIEKTSATPKKVCVYVMPFEVQDVDVKELSKRAGYDVELYSVSDAKKYDPKGKAKKAKPGLASICLE